MPLYEYECAACGGFELIRKFSDPPLRKCPRCGRKVEKRPSSPAIQFKGSGWYVTDYARKTSGGEKPADAGAEAKAADAGAEAKAVAEAKPVESARKPSKPAGAKGKPGSS